MTTFGVALSSEENSARRLVEIASTGSRPGVLALLDLRSLPSLERPSKARAPWSGRSIGAIANRRARVVRSRPPSRARRSGPTRLIVAQAAATAQDLTEGRFALGVGSGENLNEHVLGQRWPEVEIRHAMLREAVELIRAMWEGGNQSWHGEHYTVENARIYTLPPIPRHPSTCRGFGPRAIALAADIGDGYVNTSPEWRPLPATETREGPGPAVATPKCCWGPDEAECRATVHRAVAQQRTARPVGTESSRRPMLFEQASQPGHRGAVGRQGALWPRPRCRTSSRCGPT